VKFSTKIDHKTYKHAYNNDGFGDNGHIGIVIINIIGLDKIKTPKSSQFYTFCSYTGR
jgi:hypothetical protein